MGILFIGFILIFSIAALLTTACYKKMVKHEVRMAGLWATVIFLGIVTLAGAACLYAFALNFHR